MFTLSEVFEISPEYHPMLHYFLLSDTKSDILNILPPSRIFKISGRDKLCLKSTGCRDNNFGGVRRNSLKTIATPQVHYNAPGELGPRLIDFKHSLLNNLWAGI